MKYLGFAAFVSGGLEVIYSLQWARYRLGVATGNNRGR